MSRLFQKLFQNKKKKFFFQKMLGLCFMELLLNAIVIFKESLWILVSYIGDTFGILVAISARCVTNILNLSPTYFGLNIRAIYKLNER